MGNETRQLAHRGEPFCVQQTFLGALAVDGHGDLLRHEVEYALVLLVEAYALRIALDHDHADRLALAHERGADPIDGRRSNRNDLSISNEVREDLGGSQERTARPKNILGEAAAQRLPRRSAFLLVDEVGE